MNINSYRFKMGRFECIAVRDGYLKDLVPIQILFKNASKELLGQVLRSHNIQSDQWTELFTCLVINTGEHCVLVDTGLGIQEAVPEAGKLLQNLREVGIEPGDIDTVIISHAHGDHIGGTTEPRGRPAFPNARYYIHQAEWDFWTSEATLTNPVYKWMVPFVSENLLSIRDRFQFIDQDIEIVPGIRTLLSPGHTPGNISLVIESSGKQLMYLGDVIIHPLHLEQPGWYSSPDNQPAQAVSTRKSLLERASANQALIFAYHFDFPGLGYAQLQQENWKWQPINRSDI
jgi:glyoxylase-like metal-dependent hydrolase (beta-lactamase superfamily II)